ncbi:hypothetical protein C8F04DRAFT_1277348 [Mycena alexandri]|uniref:Uncharacterized protein n=1 Tax=Mycena alexandri TaxID=1745969 RepID=A0AAD6S0G1_9AGAR|nr:hypothetical protein C8F04DRAFT_1277348 [Mycena alexandri]
MSKKNVALLPLAWPTPVPQETCLVFERMRQIIAMVLAEGRTFAPHGSNSSTSQLLEASMVDILDLFDSGSLVDFEADELVHLVRALFAETALRTNRMTAVWHRGAFIENIYRKLDK